MNNITRMPQRGQSTMINPQTGQPMIWDGSNWCDCCPDMSPPPPPCPPPGWPPPGCPPWWSGMNSPPWYPGANAGVSFGTTPPPNPTRGHFWFDGVTLWIFDGAAWDSVSGPTTSTTPPTSTAPANPQPGQQWFNGTMLYVWDGNAWVPVSSTKTYIQATAPASPNPGDLWYNGTQLYIWSGTAWAIVGPGATVGPVPTTTQVFQITQTNTTGLAGGTSWYLFPFVNSPTVNVNGTWNSIQKQWTPSVAGMYFFQLTGSNYNTMTGGAWESAAVVKNDPGTFGGAAVLGDANYSPDPLSIWFSASGIMHMNGTTDYVRYWRETNMTTSESDGFTAWLLP
jgi:hypothetical protein